MSRSSTDLVPVVWASQGHCTTTWWRRWPSDTQRPPHPAGCLSTHSPVSHTTPLAPVALRPVRCCYAGQGTVRGCSSCSSHPALRTIPSATSACTPCANPHPHRLSQPSPLCVLDSADLTWEWQMLFNRGLIDYSWPSVLHHVVFPLHVLVLPPEGSRSGCVVLVQGR